MNRLVATLLLFLCEMIETQDPCLLRSHVGNRPLHIRDLDRIGIPKIAIDQRQMSQEVDHHTYADRVVHAFETLRSESIGKLLRLSKNLVDYLLGTFDTTERRSNRRWDWDILG